MQKQNTRNLSVRFHEKYHKNNKTFGKDGLTEEFYETF